uniref:Uncharacterized protein n=1 Tax=Meloidogyne enterolobii TaxID=390850 RepID=A0A6V7WW48_MELEN|nr:unnamed protein product [Meloidogyne enterolobii]
MWITFIYFFGQYLWKALNFTPDGVLFAAAIFSKKKRKKIFFSIPFLVVSFVRAASQHSTKRHEKWPAKHRGI